MFDKLKKRRGYAVDGIEGVFIRLLTQGEKPRLKAIRKLPDDECEKLGYTAEELHNALSLGFILVEASGESSIAPNADESDAQFAVRIIGELADVNDYELGLIGDAFAKLSKGERVPLDNLAKN